MLKKFLLTSFFFFSFTTIIYPTKKESTNLFDYCYSLEKILSRNAILARDNASGRVKSISMDIARFGVNNTKGSLIKKIIDQYKISNNSFLINLMPYEVYCFSGYWIEKVRPGTFESIFYERGKKTIENYKEIRDEIDGILNDINLEYESIKDEINNIFK
tara:strand:- start:704 stop:1183 length:480 start_codon:yes stop_codon:yes gene_type:complete